MNTSLFSSLAADYPLLYLNPDTDSIETYRRVVLSGEDPGTRSLAHYRGDPADREETADTPIGPVRVVTLGNRHDFELAIRGFMAAKEGPLAVVPESQGAAMLSVFNWPRIHRYVAGFPEEEKKAAFRRFTSDKKNYIDMIVVLSRGPYSHIDAAEAGYPADEWLGLSDRIRRFHELTHVICRRLYPGDIDAVRDELIADAVGLVAAFGSFDPDMEKLFLGIRDNRYTGGRLGNYTDRPEELTTPVCDSLRRIGETAAQREWTGPFDLISPLMEQIGSIRPGDQTEKEKKENRN